jgi:hypothetical protein
VQPDSCTSLEEPGGRATLQAKVSFIHFLPSVIDSIGN